MVEKDKFLVVVSVLEGRNFPKRPRHELIAEARFDGELLATDPVTHVDGPDFTQELAWELNKKNLHQHRLQRSSIKVLLYAVDTQSSMKESVGYVVLDLRSAQQKQIPKWYQVLNTKYQKSRPEVKLSLYIDDDKSGLDGSFKAKPAPARDGGKYENKALQPVLNAQESYYQIGPAEHCKDMFVLSVTVAFAANLPQLIPTNIQLQTGGYFFYYTLMGNDIKNEVFHDLMEPTFPAERASVKVRSSIKALRQFFRSQPGIEMYLCCGEQALGSVDISLGTLLEEGSTEIFMKPVTVEGSFILTPPNKVKSAMPPITDASLQPMVGVAVTLRKEEITQPQATPAEANPTTPEKTKKSPPKKEKKGKGKSKGEEKKLDLRPVANTPPPHEEEYSEAFESARSDSHAGSVKDEQLAEKKALDESGGARSKVSPREAPKQESQAKPSQDLPKPAAHHNPARLPLPAQIQQAMKANSQHAGGDMPSQAHHYSVSVDLRSIRHNHNSHNIIIRYMYPFFGTPTPILTHPPVEVRQNTEVLLPQGFCSFEFATTPQQIMDTFQRVPLLLEVWSKERGEDVLLGASQVPLINVTAGERTRAVHTNGAPGWCQEWSERLPIHSTTNPGSLEKLGELHVVVRMQDWGPIDAQKLLQQQQQQQRSPAPPPQEEEEERVEPRQTKEYQAAMELEVWKEQQEQLFEAQLKQREATRMSELAEEWRRRDREREVLLKKKLHEYQTLEDTLRKTLADLEKRDKQLGKNEDEVSQLKKDLEREHERKMTEMREASRRLKEDCDHQVHMERAKVKDLEEYVLKLKGQVSDEEAKYKQLEADFMRYKQTENCKPEVRLQSEINLLTLEKVELDRKLDAATKAKVHYKQQWGRALKEVGRLKQREQAVARQRLRQQQHELEHMRLRYLAAEEHEAVSSERKQLADIKNELHMLRGESELRTDESKATTAGGGGGGMTGGIASGAPGGVYGEEDDDGDEHITRLLEERDSLLRTDVYSNDDPIISELDRQIRQAIASKGNAVLTT